MKYSTIPSAQLVVGHCKARGIEHIVISPGSRNAPLTLGFTADDYFRCYSIVDERSAGFFALGLAQQIKAPVAVLCTSGSALLNYYPAVAEAFYSNIPLVILSADRPQYKIDIGDGQTIRQDKVFDRHIGFSAQLWQDATHAAEEQRNWGVLQAADDSATAQEQLAITDRNEVLLNQGMEIAFQQLLPVHFNIPFEEPLYNTTDLPSAAPKPAQFSTVPGNYGQTLTEFSEQWNAAARKIVLIGMSAPEFLNPETLEFFAGDPSVIVLTETTSNVHHPSFYPSIDSIIAPLEIAAEKEELFGRLQPDIVVTLGSLIVSKKVKAFMRKYKPKQHWHLGSTRAYNTFNCDVRSLPMAVDEIVAELANGYSRPQNGFRDFWDAFKQHYTACRTAYLSDIPFTDFQAFHALLGSIPESYQLQLANSSTIRYTQLFDIRPDLRVYCNRGTSGIDGSTSTAVGAAWLVEQPTLFITGDLSFLYDTNGLWNEYLRPDFRIIVLNNGGGGIFRILPGSTDSKNFETYFETVHRERIDLRCQAFGLEHFFATNLSELQEQLKEFFQVSDKPRLLEIQTPRTVNDKILLGYFEFISSGLSQVLENMKNHG